MGLIRKLKKIFDKEYFVIMREPRTDPDSRKKYPYAILKAGIDLEVDKVVRKLNNEDRIHYYWLEKIDNIFSE